MMFKQIYEAWKKTKEICPTRDKEDPRYCRKYTQTILCNFHVCSHSYEYTSDDIYSMQTLEAEKKTYILTGERIMDLMQSGDEDTGLLNVIKFWNIKELKEVDE